MSRIVVIGGGLLGAATAHRLAVAGVEVTLVEGRSPGSGTSGRTFAWLNAQEKSPAHYFELNVAGLHSYGALREELGDDAWYHPGGDLAIGIGASAGPVVDRAQRHRAVGYPVRELAAAELAELEPHVRLDPDTDVAIAHYPEEAWIEADVLVRQLVEAAVAAGASLVIADPVVDLERERGRVAAVRLRSGTRLEADRFVLAAGPDSQALAGSAGIRLPMAPTPGLLAITGPTDVRVGRVIHAGPLSLRPEPGGRLMLASRSIDRELPVDATTVDPAGPECAALLELARRLLPGLADATIEEVRIGRRSVAEDGLPVAGPAPAAPELYLLVSHSGATLAPLLGRLAASELIEAPVATLEPYRPDRFD